MTQSLLKALSPVSSTRYILNARKPHVDSAKTVTVRMWTMLLLMVLAQGLDKKWIPLGFFPPLFSFHCPPAPWKELLECLDSARC